MKNHPSTRNAGLKWKYITSTLLLCIFTTSTLLAQLTPFEEWNTSTGSQNFFIRSTTITDGSGNIYVAGGTVNGSGNYDILVSKFNSSGNHLWTQQTNGSANFQDAATAITVDGSGNVYITGFIANSFMNGTDAITIKYNSSGVQQWTAVYNGSGSSHDFGTDIFVDGSGNVYISGSCQNTTPNADVLVIKYNSSGAQQWVNVFNYNAANLDDVGHRIKSFGSGRITVAGIVQTAANTYSYGHLVYNTSTGAITGNLVLGSSTTDIGRTVSLVQDSDGNTFIAGAIDNGVGHGLDFCVIKFDTTAAIVWESHYNGTDGLEDVATDLAVDANGFVYVGGYTTTNTEGTNYTTLKLTPNGDQVWESHLDGIGHGADTATALLIHNDTTLVITGTSFNGSNQDYYTVKYDTSGTELWKIAYNSYHNKADWAHSIAEDTLGAIIVTGQSYNDTSISYTTIKYIDPYIMDTLTDGIPESQSFYFIENRGLLIDTDTLSLPGIKFYNNQQEYSSYFTDTLISYVFSSIDTSLATDDSLHRVDLRFINPLAGAKVYGKDVRSDYYNYYIPQTAPYGRERVPLFGELYMPSLWNNIDLKITSNPGGIKYAFILYPGFDPEQPSFSIEGYDDLDAHHGTVFIETSLGNIELPLADEAFQIDVNGDHIPLGWRPEFDLDHNVVNFVDFGSYDTDLPLVFVIENDYAAMGGGGVEPVWSTFIPGDGNDVANDVTNDPNGNTYIVGETYSTIFPIFGSSIFQGTNAGNYDAFAAQFDIDYEREWVTFYGGTEEEFGISLAYDDFAGEKLYIVGSSNSNVSSLSIVPSVISVSYQETSSNLAKKGMLARFDANNGSREWGTFFGGTKTIVTGIDCDAYGNFFITGHTENTNYNTSSCTGNANTFPGCNLAGSTDFFQPWFSLSGCAFSSFYYEAFIARFNNDCQLTYSSLFGGCGNDQAYDIAVDKQNEKVFIVGFTQAEFDNSLGLTCVGNQAGFPVCDLGGTSFFQGGLNGNSINSGPYNDGFIARFNATTMRMELSTYFGGNNDDFITGIDIGNNSDIYVSGITLTGSSEDICSIGNGTQFFPTCGTLPLSFGGGVDNFVAKFDGAMNLEWSTYFGGVSNESYIHLYLPDGTFYGPRIAYSPFHDKVFIQGVTETGSASNDDIPLQISSSFFNSQSGHNDPGSNRNTDCFIAGFLPDGTFDYANYYGGTGFKNGTSNPRLGDMAGGISTSNERIYICGGTFSTSNFPLACPSTTNPYCIDYSLASISNTNSDAYLAQIYNNPFLSIENQLPDVVSAFIYPNPASHSFTIEFNSLNYSTETIEIYNLLGEMVSSRSINTTVGKNKTEIDASFLTEGLYLVCFKNSRLTAKIIIQK